MIRKTKLGPIRATWVLRHRWESGAKDGVLGRNYEAYKLRSEFRLGIWAKRDKVVGPVKRNDEGKTLVSKTFGPSNLVNTYMIGLNLIVCKMWVEISFRPHLGENIK
jgi:hypothetical protein